MFLNILGYLTFKSHFLMFLNFNVLNPLQGFSVVAWSSFSVLVLAGKASREPQR